MNTKLNIIQALATLILVLSTFTAHAGQTSYFIYDEAGHVIGEYDANGNPIQEHVYLGDRPIAVVQGSSGGTMDYVSTDQLNTPRVVTDSSKNVLWAWNSDPFGNGSPTGSLSYNLRFPGQYYDAETGHNYNYARDYDPTIGRYTESDPIGLGGGLNTYTYVRNDPLQIADPLGKACPAGSAPNCDSMYPPGESACVTAECAAGVLPNQTEKGNVPCIIACNLAATVACFKAATSAKGDATIPVGIACRLLTIVICSKACDPNKPSSCPANTTSAANSGGGKKGDGGSP